MSDNALSVAVIGAEYRGKNLVRNFVTTKRCALRTACDINEALLVAHQRSFPFLSTTTDVEMVLRDDRVQAVVIPTIPGAEPLALECRHFVECLLESRPVRTDGADGLRIVQVLEAGQESLKNHGMSVDPRKF